MAFKQRGPLLALRCAVLFLIPVTLLPIAGQARWEITPFIEGRGAYTDNIELVEDEDSDFVAQLNPGIAIRKPEGRLQVQLDYLLQNFYSFEDSDLSSDHQLDSFGRYEAIEDHFFIDAYATIVQVIQDTDGTLSSSNLNNTGNTTDERTLGIEPRWQQRLGGIAFGELRYLYEDQHFDDETAGDVGDDSDLDSNDRQRFTALVRNQDPDANRLDWGVRYQDAKINFDDGDTTEFERTQLDLGYAVTSRYEVVGSYGYENNDFEFDPSVDDPDDDFWDVGLIAQVGEFTSLEVRRGERFFGNTWLGDLQIEGGKLRLNATYEEDITVGSRSASETRDFLEDPIRVERDVRVDEPADRNSVYESKRWDVALSYEISKSTFTVTGYDEDLEFLDTLDKEQTKGAAFSWLWQVSGKSA